MAAVLVGRGGVIREINDVIKTTILIGCYDCAIMKKTPKSRAI